MGDQILFRSKNNTKTHLRRLPKLLAKDGDRPQKGRRVAHEIEAAPRHRRLRGDGAGRGAVGDGAEDVGDQLAGLADESSSKRLGAKCLVYWLVAHDRSCR